MEQHFDELVDYDFTARVETDLDAIAAGERQKDQWLQSFYFGDDALPGLKRLVEENLDEIDAAAINTFPIGIDADGNEVVVKPGKYGPVRQARRGHGQRARRPDARRADDRQGARAARRAEVRRADRRARRAPGVRQERPLRAVRAVGHAGRPAAGAGQAEDVEPVQDDGPRADHDGRGRGAAAAAAHARHRPGRRRADRRQQRPLRAVRAEGPGLPQPRSTRTSCSRSRSTTRCGSSPSRRCSAAAGRTWPPRARCASSAPIP